MTAAITPTTAPGVPAVSVRAAAMRRPGVRWVLLIAIAALLTLALRAFVVQSFVIPSGSMAPNLQPGDRVLVARWDRQPQRGDVVVFDGTGVFAPANDPATPVIAAAHAIGGPLGLPVGEPDFVKRVIGVGGDRVACCTADGRLTVNGAALSEHYLAPGEAPSLVRFDVQVPAGKLWLLGDHRSDSGDSRAHLGDPGGGLVPVEHVIGRVIAVWWPLTRWQSIDPGQSGGAMAVRGSTP